MITIALFLLALAALSMLYTAVSSCFCHIDAQPPERKRYERAQAANCAITIANRSVLPLPGIALHLCVESDDGFAPLVTVHRFALRPKERVTLDLPLEFPHIGHYRIRVSRLRFYGLLGIFAITRRPRWSAPVHITPKLYKLPSLEVDTTRAMFAVDFVVPHKLSGGEYSDVRQYAPGDPIKNIHWKLSAHSSEYITRVFSTDAVSGVSVYMDFRVPPRTAAADIADINDSTAESGYATAMRTLELGYVAELVYSRSGAPFSMRPADRDELTALAYSLPPVSAKERYPVEQLVAEYSGAATSPDTIICITGNITERLIGVLADCSQRGKYPMLLHIGAGDETIAERLRVKGVRYRAITAAAELTQEVTP